MMGTPTASPSTDKQGQTLSSGFVLVEVLVSMTLFAVGIMAVLTSVLSVLELQKDAALRYRAGLILQEKLAETVLVPYDGQPVRGLSPDGVFSWSMVGEAWADAPEVPAFQPETGGRGRNRKSPSEMNDTGTGNLSGRIIQVAVDVSWQTSEGSRSINATQLVHQARQAGGTP